MFVCLMEKTTDMSQVRQTLSHNVVYLAPIEIQTQLSALVIIEHLDEDQQEVLHLCFVHSSKTLLLNHSLS
jgi:hypothetical protein